MFTVFFHNMTMIVTFMYLFTRFDYYFQTNTKKSTYYAWVVAMVSLLSILAMLHPFKLDGMIFDLRDVPLLLVSCVLGWRLGLASMLLPALYRGYIAGPTAWQGVLVMIILPVIVGGFFSKSNQLNTHIKISIIFQAFITYSFFKLVFMKVLTGIQFSDWLIINLNHVIFSALSLLCMILMLNDALKSRKLKDKLEYMSKHDSLTNLINLQHFKEEVSTLLTHKTPVAIAMLDLDYFKEYNDKYGHPAGDKVLEEFATLLKLNTRQSDLVARYGGEEFIICFTNYKHPDNVQLSLERLRQVIATHPFQERQPDGSITVSIGVSYSNPDKSLDYLIQEADQALYKSKSKGRNIVTNFTDLAIGDNN